MMEVILIKIIVLVKVVKAVYSRVHGFRSHAERDCSEENDIRLYYYYLGTIFMGKGNGY